MDSTKRRREKRCHEYLFSFIYLFNSCNVKVIDFYRSSVLELLEVCQYKLFLLLPCLTVIHIKMGAQSQ